MRISCDKIFEMVSRYLSCELGHLWNWPLSGAYVWTSCVYKRMMAYFYKPYKTFFFADKRLSKCFIFVDMLFTELEYFVLACKKSPLFRCSVAVQRICFNISLVEIRRQQNRLLIIFAI